MPAPCGPSTGSAAPALPNDGKLSAEHLPVITLKDGTKAQTGTAARLVISIQEYNALPEDAAAERADLLRQMETAIAPLHAVGLMGLFSPQEWVGDGSNPGREAFGRAYQRWLEKQPAPPTLAEAA